MAVLTFLGQGSELDALKNGEHASFNLERYIQKNLDKDQTYYLVEKDFWDSWTQNKADKFEPKLEMKQAIDNQRLIEPYHVHRLRDDMVYGVHFVIVPKYVFKSLRTWYSCNCTIERPVHSFKRDVTKGTRHLDSVRQSQGARSSRDPFSPHGGNGPLSPKKYALHGMPFQGQGQDHENPETVQGGEASS